MAINRHTFEILKVSFFLLLPIAVMYYIGIDTDKKLNVPGFWPDPSATNKIPKEPYEIKAELLRMQRADAAKRARLEERARQQGLTEEKVREMRQEAEVRPEAE